MSSSSSTFAAPSPPSNDQCSQPTVARTLEQELYLQNQNQVALDKAIHTTMDYSSPENDILSTTTASLNELSQASLDYFSNYTASPAKMSQLQGLITSLHTLLSDQSYAMGDLRTQLDEIQEVLNRVQPKQDTMTSQERQIVHNAQMMKNLAEEVIATKVEKRDSGFQDSLTSKSPLMVSLSALRSLSAPDAPPPTTKTPPSFDHRPSSTTPSLSSLNTERQYTLDDDRSSRPSSVSSSYRHQQKKKRQSLRQLESLNGGQGRYEEESNAAFERICSLLTHLITDASTAVGTAADGTLPNIPFPQMSPLEPSDYEQSSSEEDDEEYENLGVEQEIDDMAVADHEEQLLGDEEMDDHHRLYLSKSPAHSVGDDNQSEDEPGFNSLRYRTGNRNSLRPDRSANRLSSLFMELQNTQSNDPTLEDPDKSSGVPGSLDDELPAEYERRPRKSTSLTSLSSSAGKIRRLSVITKKPSMEITSLSEPLVVQSTSVTPRHRSSFSSLRSPRLQLPRTDELQENRQVEVELDRTVETIDGLTRELVAVATHQNWMQMKLQRTLQFQKQQVEQIESSLSTATTTSANLRSLPLSSTGDQGSSHPLEDLSRSLKQVAVNVGKVIASTTKPTMPSLHSSSVPADQGTLRTRLPQQKGNLSRVDTRTVTKRRFGKEFSKYFQELEKIAALGSKLGFGKVDDLNENDDTEDAQPQETFEDAQNQEPSHGSRSTTGPSSPTSMAPPDLEDFAAQCRLLTRALVLPFVQLTHHAMTSQDSVLALSPTTRAVDQSDWDSLNMEESLDHRSMHSRDTSYHSATEESFSPHMSPGRHQSSARRRSSAASHPSWPSSPLFSGGDLDSILRSHGSELSPDSIVKAKTIISTGLYLIHLLYWTVLFVIGSLVLDPWLAETAGQQVIRIVDQVREALAVAGIGAPKIEGQDAKVLGTIEEPPFFARSDEHLYEHHQADVLMERLSLDSHRDPLTSLTPISERDLPESTAARIQALEDRAIEVAVGFETLKNRLSGPSSPISTSRPGSGLWGRKDSFQSTSSAFSSTLSATGTNSPEPDRMTGGLMRTGSWVGPRRRRLTHNKDSKTRRFSSASRTPTMPVVVPRSVEGVTGNGRRPRPMSHWGSFGPTIDFGSVSSPSSHEPSSISVLSSTASSITTLSDWATGAGVGLGKDFGLIATATATIPETINVVTVASIGVPRSRRNSM
ncbi:hypothetical protein CPC16_007478 [Podila verticillata]|nr:hypothetical protein CPC16_007478 [Podila verticillata]